MPEEQIGAYVIGWEGHGTEWRLWCDELDWSSVVSVQAYGKPLTDLFATSLPTTLIQQRHPRAVIDVSAMPDNDEFRFWVEFTLTDTSVIRVPDTYDLLTKR
jgi:hypothetical protein